MLKTGHSRSPPSPIPSSRRPSPHVVTAQQSRSSSSSSDLVSNWIAGSDLEHIEHQDKYFNFQCGGSMVSGSTSNSRNENLEGNWKALLDVGGLSVRTFIEGCWSTSSVSCGSYLCRRRRYRAEPCICVSPWMYSPNKF
jgi:hypothetical protein